MSTQAGATIDLSARGLRAFLFDLDGVITDTASVHAAAWKALFDGFLRDRAEGDAFQPFRPEDYSRFVDGKPRFDGVRSFLASRGIELPEGREDDPGERPTVYGLGNRKNVLFNTVLEEQGVEVFESSVRLVRDLRARGRRTACVSSSRNCRPVLRRAGIEDLFDAVVDGTDLAREGLPGKPAPDAFLGAARRLHVPPVEAAVVEDAPAGVEAGRAGGFGLVIGIDRGAGASVLEAHGADLVVDDLGRIRLA